MLLIKKFYACPFRAPWRASKLLEKPNRIQLLKIWIFSLHLFIYWSNLHTFWIRIQFGSGATICLLIRNSSGSILLKSSIQWALFCFTFLSICMRFETWYNGMASRLASTVCPRTATRKFDETIIWSGCRRLKSVHNHHGKSNGKDGKNTPTHSLSSTPPPTPPPPPSSSYCGYW